MKIEILETVTGFLFNEDGSNPVGNIKMFRKGTILELDSVGEYEGKYSPRNITLFKISFSDGTYTTLTKGYFQVIE